MLTTDGTPVHFPANPAKFEFDGEVAKIFPDMAARSIPNFHAAHAAHVNMAAALLSTPGCRVLDIGASRGHFYAHMLEAGYRDTKYVAVDNSEAMCSLLKKDYPEAEVHCMDLREPGFRQLVSGQQFDIVVCNYVAQFLPPADQIPMLLSLLGVLAPGGMFFLGHKSKHYGSLGEAAHLEYLRFRMQNGYTREEIEAKTLALKGSMFPMDHAFVMSLLATACREVQETTRFMMFSTIAARK